MSATHIQPKGFRSIIANLGIKDSRDDFMAVISDVPASISAVFTQSRFAGPSVTLSREVAQRDTFGGCVGPSEACAERGALSWVWPAFRYQLEVYQRLDRATSKRLVS